MTNPQDAPADYGVIGVGALAEAIVTGLSEGRPDAPRILLSPRGRERSARLAATYATVTAADDNQAVVDGASTILLCVRPQDAREVVGSLEFTSDHRIVSVMGAPALDGLAELVAPAADIVRALPNPAVGTRQGVTPLHPGGTPADELFDLLGGAMVLEEERLLDAAGTASSTVATHISYLVTVSQWLTDQGVASDVAQRYVASIFAGVGAELRGVSDIAPLVASHATKGGSNERLERLMRDRGVFTALTDSLDELHTGP